MTKSQEYETASQSLDQTESLENTEGVPEGWPQKGQ